MAGESVLGAAPVGDGGGAAGTLATINRWVRAGAGAVADAAADERTGLVIDRVAGPQWRWAARAASVAVVAAREAMRAPGPRDPDDAVVGVRDAGEPASFPTKEKRG